MAVELRGSCLCGGIAFVASGPLAGALNRHCSMCREARAAAFRTRAGIERADVRWLRGEELLTRYEFSPETLRTFCRVCGTRLVSEFTCEPEALGLPLGVLDDDPGVKPALHLHVASKTLWYEIMDDLPQFAEPPPG